MYRYNHAAIAFMLKVLWSAKTLCAQLCYHAHHAGLFFCAQLCFHAHHAGLFFVVVRFLACDVLCCRLWLHHIGSRIAANRPNVRARPFARLACDMVALLGRWGTSCRHEHHMLSCSCEAVKMMTVPYQGS